MDRQEANTRILELKDILKENNRRYYVDNSPVISDFEYDRLMRELEDLEKEFPEFLTQDSPTQKVGSDLEAPVGDNAEPGTGGNFVKRKHRYPMLSLGNTYSISEIEEFSSRADKALDNAFTYCCELKFDGTAICLTYNNGKLAHALTRGDGVYGDDVTENVRHISNIPQNLHGDFPEEFEIRGEILMPYDAFDRLNREREDNEEPPFANPRNAASGSLKLADSEEVGHRGLMCTLYHIPAQSLDFTTHDEALSAAESWGLPVSHERRICNNINDIREYISFWDEERKNLPFATDGIVIKINEMDSQRELGYTAKSPRWAVAYKFKAEQALTPILSIAYQVGRTGAITPVANLAPVQLSGTVVKRATLVNEDQIRALDIHIGDWVYVEKGGEIIPKITGIEPSRRSLGALPEPFPTVCPDCGTPLVREADEAKAFCPNQDGCPMQIKGRLIHFMSRKAMNILAGEATVDQLYNLDLVRTPADLYDLTKSRLLVLEGWRDRSADRFLSSLESSRNVSFEKVLYALGIRYVGESTARGIARHFRNVDAIAEASMDDLLEVPDVGDVIAKSVFDFFIDARHAIEIQRLRAAGLKFSVEEEMPLQSEKLKGKTIVVSGNFTVSRDALKELISANGGKNSTSVSGSTSFLLAGLKAGPEKLKKCTSLGIPILSEDEFRREYGFPAENSEPSLF